MGKSQRDKGARIERKVVALLKENKVDAERVPLSGAALGNFAGDIRLESGQIIEVKGRQTSGVYWRTAEKHLGSHNYLFLWEDRKPEPLVVMTFDEFMILWHGDR